MKQTINERIKMLRTHLNLTGEGFANLIDITSAQLSRIENGKSDPQNGTINKIIDKTSVSQEWLLHGKGELKAQVITSSSQVDPWKDVAFSQVAGERDNLKKEVERLWQMVAHYTSGAKPNFRNAFGLAELNFNKLSGSTKKQLQPQH